MGNEQFTPALTHTNSAISAGRCIAQLTVDSKQLKAKSRKLEKQLKDDIKNESKYTKLLVLGAGESGKSTIIKQMKLIHPNVDGREDQGFSKEECLAARKAIYLNIVDNMNNLLNAVENLDIPGWQNVLYTGSDMQTPNQGIDGIDAYYTTLLSHTPKGKDGEEVFDPKIAPTPEVLDAVKQLWSNQVIQKAYKRRNEFQLADSMAYFMKDVERICAAEYEPTDQDVLRCRVKTTGLSSVEFTFKKYSFACLMSVDNVLSVKNGFTALITSRQSCSL